VKHFEEMWSYAKQKGFQVHHHSVLFSDWWYECVFLILSLW
jgi:hypothetical protein